jgi:murein L,D-transpeptidase YcbB/YkuD
VLKFLRLSRLWLASLALGCLLAIGVVAQPQDVSGRIHEILDKSGGANFDTRDLDIATLKQFYALRSYQPAWTGNAVTERDAKSALALLERADEDGLEPEAYHVREIHLRLHAKTIEAAAEYDLLLTDGLLRFIRDLRVGRPQLRALDADVDLPVESFKPAVELDAALRRNGLDQFLASMAPTHPEYGRLKQGLARYRRIAAAGGWQPISSSLTGGIDAEPVQPDVLRQRLALEDEALISDPQGDLQVALENFQRRHGLEADGRIGKKTLQALNESPSARAAEIALNMERWRWVPRDFGPRYIAVNAADATLVVVDHGQIVLSSKVIVGKPATRTAVFTAKITDVTVNPYWNIPAAIARNEILPKARRNPAYLGNHHMFFDSTGMLRQSPGPDNSLGRLKMEMPNRFNAYLHDTPARSLFAAKERHLSHGCIRVEQIKPLASFALTGDAALGLENLQEAISSNVNKRISLDNPLPVFVLYWTAIADKDGTVEFRPDVYGRDQRLLAALAGRRLVGRVTMNSDTECRKV